MNEVTERRTDEQIIADLTKALIIVHKNLIGEGSDAWKPMSVKYAHKLAIYIERILRGETPEQIADTPEISGEME